MMHCAKRLFTGVALAMGLFTASAAQAQFGTWYHPYGYGYGGGFGGGTAEGNALQGMSTVIRSAGEYNLYTSMAGVNNEEARSKYLDNKRKWNQNYQQMREWHTAMEAQKREADRQSRESRYAAAKATSPARPMAPEALDSVTGQITWPETLLANEFEKPRSQIEQLFKLRAQTSQTAVISSQIHAVTEEMAKILRSHIAKIPANEYVAARKFIDELDHTARAKSL